jgi:hypothetical protein
MVKVRLVIISAFERDLRPFAALARSQDRKAMAEAKHAAKMFGGQSGLLEKYATQLSRAYAGLERELIDVDSATLGSYQRTDPLDHACLARTA